MDTAFWTFRGHWVYTVFSGSSACSAQQKLTVMRTVWDSGQPGTETAERLENWQERLAGRNTHRQTGGWDTETGGGELEFQKVLTGELIKTLLGWYHTPRSKLGMPTQGSWRATLAWLAW